MRALLAATAVVLMAMGSAQAQDSGPVANCQQVRIVVPYPAGGATDVATRIVAERMMAALKRPVVVENRGGATGNIGTIAVIKSAPDGCVLLVNATVIATFVHSMPNLPYDPHKDLMPIGGVGITPTLIVSAPSVKAGTLKELIALSKGESNGLNYSSAGYGLQQHLAMEEIARRTGAKWTHVPYKGGGPAMNDLMAGRLDVGAFLAGTTKPFVESGKLKAYAIVAEKRSPLMPDVPTTTEQGLSDMNAGVHFMLFAPAGTPEPAIALYEKTLRSIVAEPELAERFVKIGFEATPMTAKEVDQRMRETGDRLAPLIKQLKIRLE